MLAKYVYAIALHKPPKTTKSFWLVNMSLPDPGLIQYENSLAVTRGLDFLNAMSFMHST